MKKSEYAFAIVREIFLNTPHQLSSEELCNDALGMQLYRLFKEHDLAHMLGYYAKKQKLNLTPDLQKKLELEMNQAVFRYMTISHELESICQLLDKHQIPFIPLKGSALRQYYPEPWLRTSCDIDIYVKEEHLPQALKVLETEMGCKIGQRGFHDVVLSTPLKVTLELHYMLVEKSERAYDLLLGVWNDATLMDGYKYGYRMSNEMFMLFHIAHMAKHFFDGGCGIRPFIDAYIIKTKMGYDESKLEAMLQECGMRTFYDALLALTDVWFFEKEHTELTKEMEDYILSAGVYGTTENRVAIAQTASGSKLKYTLQRLFPPFERMAQRYPRLRRFALLLPWYYLKRWLSFVFTKDKTGALRELHYNSSVSDEKKERLRAMCQSLGL